KIARDRPVRRDRDKRSGMLGREASPAGCRSGIERGKMIARCACSRRGSASGGDECPAPAGSARSRGLVVSGVTPPRGGGRHYRYEVDRPGTGRARDLDDARPGPGPGRVGASCTRVEVYTRGGSKQSAVALSYLADLQRRRPWVGVSVYDVTTDRAALDR